MEKRKIIAIDIAVIGVSFVLVLLAVNYARPLVIFPVNDFSTTNDSVLFSFQKGNVIEIDDNPNFTSPQKISATNNLVINLEPGLYYWKVEGILDSSVRTINIKSRVDLKLKDAGSQYQLVNAGNTLLNVDLYNGTKYTGNITLGTEQSKNVSGTVFVGRQSNE